VIYSNIFKDLCSIFSIYAYCLLR